MMVIYEEAGCIVQHLNLQNTKELIETLLPCTLGIKYFTVSESRNKEKIIQNKYKCYLFLQILLQLLFCFGLGHIHIGFLIFPLNTLIPFKVVV